MISWIQPLGQSIVADSYHLVYNFGSLVSDAANVSIGAESIEEDWYDMVYRFGPLVSDAANVSTRKNKKSPHKNMK